MLRWLSRQQLSLATKCQLLFGTAAGLIILAALAVAWQRIGQLTRGQDLVAADVLVSKTLAEHAAAGTPARGLTAVTEEATVRLPRLVSAEDDEAMTPFERTALAVFRERPSRDTFREPALLADDEGRPREVAGARTARAARLEARCISCHAGPAAWSPVVAPTPEAARAMLEAGERPLMGVVSVELAGQTSRGELLINRGFLITAAVTSAMAAALTLYLILTRLILSPVRVLQDVAERVRGGDLQVRADVKTGDEFETLARTVNEMIGGLHTRNEQLARANRSLDKRLGDLAQANVALDESNRLKSEFLANVSHELRTPLNSILGFADLVRGVRAGDGKKDAKLDRYADNIKRSGQSLLELINDLLDLAKIEAGRMEVRRGELSLVDLFEALTVLLGPIAAKRRVKVVHEVGPKVPIIRSDPGKLQQILYNLLSNAIKFSPAQGRVDLVARRELDDQGEPANFVRITVTDQGPGVAEEDHERIFEKFRQIDASATREHGGTGLGLAISRELADLLGGELGVISKPGEGATFYLRLPTSLPGATGS